MRDNTYLFISQFSRDKTWFGENQNKERTSKQLDLSEGWVGALLLFLDKKDDSWNYFLYPQYTRIITRKEKSAAVSALSLNHHSRRTGRRLLPGMLWNTWRETLWFWWDGYWKTRHGTIPVRWMRCDHRNWITQFMSRGNNRPYIFATGDDWYLFLNTLFIRDSFHRLHPAPQYVFPRPA